MGAVFCVSSVNQMLSVVVTVLPRGCWYTSPTSKSSKNRPFQPSFTAMRIPFLCATQELERPAGQENLALSGRLPDLERDLRPVVGVFQECIFSRGDHFTHAFDLPLIARARPLVVVLLAKEQRQDALTYQVAAAEHVLRALGDVRPEAHPQGAIRRHVSCGDVVLDQDLVDGEVDLFAGNEVAFQQMVTQHFLGKVARPTHARHALLSARDAVRTVRLEL